MLIFILLHGGESYSFHKSKNERRDALAPSTRRRGCIICGIVGVASSPFLPWCTSPVEARAVEQLAYGRIETTEGIAKFLRQRCNPKFLSNVVESNYNFLYRGLYQEENLAAHRNNELAAIIIKEEPHDLLSPETYQSKDAASYFQSIENDMTSKGIMIKPSNSHIGTTCPTEAAKWGAAASVWPLGSKGVGFAWVDGGGTFWPKKSDSNRLIVTTTANDDRLSEILQGDAWDIMFRADNGWVAVPAELDDQLRACLRNMN